MAASHSGHIDVVKVLLENDAQVDLQGNHGQSSLMAASHSGHVDIVGVLLEKYAQVDLQGSDGTSPLMVTGRKAMLTPSSLGTFSRCCSVSCAQIYVLWERDFVLRFVTYAMHYLAIAIQYSNNSLVANS